MYMYDANYKVWSEREESLDVPAGDGVSTCACGEEEEGAAAGIDDRRSARRYEWALFFFRVLRPR